MSVPQTIICIAPYSVRCIHVYCNPLLAEKIVFKNWMLDSGRASGWEQNTSRIKMLLASHFDSPSIIWRLIQKKKIDHRARAATCTFVRTSPCFADLSGLTPPRGWNLGFRWSATAARVHGSSRSLHRPCTRA